MRVFLSNPSSEPISVLRCNGVGRGSDMDEKDIR